MGPADPARERRLAWSDLLERVWQADVLSCPTCGGRMRKARRQVVRRMTVLKELSARRGFTGWCERHGLLGQAPTTKSSTKEVTGHADTRTPHPTAPVAPAEDEVEGVIAEHSDNRPGVAYIAGHQHASTTSRCGHASRRTAEQVLAAVGGLRTPRPGAGFLSPIWHRFWRGCGET